MDYGGVDSGRHGARHRVMHAHGRLVVMPGHRPVAAVARAHGLEGAVWVHDEPRVAVVAEVVGQAVAHGRGRAGSAVGRCKE